MGCYDNVLRTHKVGQICRCTLCGEAKSQTTRLSMLPEAHPLSLQRTCSSQILAWLREVAGGYGIVRFYLGYGILRF